MLISVIVPIYNAAQFLDECIQSILKQNVDDFELLLINDGSTDHSGKICDQYAAIDNRIKVFHKINGGVSSARNLGIENAKGEWIAFVDSDDYVQDNYFLSLTREENIDLVIQGFDYLEDEVKVKEVKYDEHIFTKPVLVNEYCLYPDFSSSWAKFFRKEIVNRHQLEFNERLTFGEDSIFTLQYLLVCENIMTTDISRYSYRVVDTGLTNTKLNFEHDKSFYETIKKVLKGFENEIFYKESLQMPLTRFLSSLYSYKEMNSIERRKFLKNEIEENYSIIYSIYTNPKIVFFIRTAYFTGNYFLLDCILNKLNK